MYTSWIYRGVFNNDNAVCYLKSILKKFTKITKHGNTGVPPLTQTGSGFSRVITRSDVMLLCVSRENCRAISPIFLYRAFFL